MPISCLSLQSPSIRLRKYIVKGRDSHTFGPLAISALRGSSLRRVLDTAAAVRGNAGRENVSSCGATSSRPTSSAQVTVLELNCVPVF